MTKTPWEKVIKQNEVTQLNFYLGVMGELRSPITPRKYSDAVISEGIKHPLKAIIMIETGVTDPLWVLPC